MSTGVDPPQLDDATALQGGCDAIGRLLAVSGTQLQWLQAMLAKVVDWDASSQEGRVCIQSGACPPLLPG